ncbi:MAG: hypothetical protein L3J37_06375 [Rhodobacteraceae bacterium]|nr:hypothetical protein [Paracoccaceae bacterium]
MRIATRVYAKRTTGGFFRVLFAVGLLLALTLNPIAMRNHMANASPVQSEISFGSGEVAAPGLHALHITKQADSTANGKICPQMAPCTAILASYGGPLLAEFPMDKQVLPSVPLADGRALAPPFHPPIT